MPATHPSRTLYRIDECPDLMADDERDACALVGDDMELVQPLRIAPEGQASQKLLDGGVARPDRQEDQIALVIADASIGHHVGAFVDAIQRGGRSVFGHGGVLG